MHSNVPFDRLYGKYCVVICDEQVDTTEKIRRTPYLTECKKYMEKTISTAYSASEIKECKQKCSTTEHQIPKHSLLPIIYSANTVHKFNNCVYYDINNAHLDALVEIFPKASKQLIGLREKINKYKANGDYINAQLIKDYINFYVGGLGKKITDINGKVIGYNEDRPTYEWIVNRTRQKLQAIIDDVDGLVLYSNTDGVMIQNPTNKISTSNKLGDCKSELKDDVIYAFTYNPSIEERAQGYTPYFVYQYLDANGNWLTKGNISYEVRDKLDLRIGQYPIYKKTKIDGYFEFHDIKIIEGDVQEWQ